MFSLNIVSQAPRNLFCSPLLYDQDMGIGARLRQLRKANKLSGEKFGDLCGVTKGTVSQWESDQTTPTLDRLVELHKRLDFSFDWLLNGKDDEAATAYTTTDPTLIEMLRVLEPRADYFKETALKTVISTIDLVDHASAAPTKAETEQPAHVTREHTVTITERRRAKANASIQFADRRQKNAKDAS